MKYLVRRIKIDNEAQSEKGKNSRKNVEKGQIKVK